MIKVSASQSTEHRRMGLKMKKILLSRKLDIRKKEGYKSMIQVVSSKWMFLRKDTKF